MSERKPFAAEFGEVGVAEAALAQGHRLIVVVEVGVGQGNIRGRHQAAVAVDEAAAQACEIHQRVENRA